MNCSDGLIQDLVFFGDFFSLKSPEILAKMLIGAPLEQQALTKILKNVQISDFFHNMNQDIFLSYLLESE